MKAHFVSHRRSVASSIATGAIVVLAASGCGGTSTGASAGDAATACGDYFDAGEKVAQMGEKVAQMGALKQGALAAEVHVISPRFLPLVLEEPTHLARARS